MTGSEKKQVLQIAPTLEVNDAVSNDVLQIDRFLRQSGFSTKIFTIYHSAELAGFRLPADTIGKYATDDTVIFYHYPLHSNISEILKKVPGKKILIYHNVTPAKFFEGLDQGLFQVCKDGVDKLSLLKDDYVLGLGDSEFNRIDLLNAGFKNTGTLPILLDVSRFRQSNEQLIAKLTEGGTVNLLYVGRISPNKKQEDAIKIFYYYHNYINSNCQLYLVGKEQVPVYVNFLKLLIARLGLTDKVHFTGSVSNEDMTAYYRSASIFLCMSEHEGFCVPLLEAMYFNVPILAYNSSGVPFTLGGSGILVNRKDHAAIAEMVDQIISDDQLRRMIIERQTDRLGNFSIDKVGKQILDIIDNVSGGSTTL
ncbi:glycosyltransferase [Methanocella sp. MCL-LM]|uniref:glycosyltransferase n=1 Tax=Methanocella sp. MCL-LM TaxID=3412035 RepID=UPI003C779FE4